MKRTLGLVFVVFMVLAPVQASPDGGRNGCYRFPAIHGDTVVFTSEGDLWTVDVRGGTARRLTSRSGIEAYPAISPDGREDLLRHAEVFDAPQRPARGGRQAPPGTHRQGPGRGAQAPAVSR